MRITKPFHSDSFVKKRGLSLTSEWQSEDVAWGQRYLWAQKWLLFFFMLGLLLIVPWL